MKSITISTIVSVLLVAGAIIVTQDKDISPGSTTNRTANAIDISQYEQNKNVTVIDGVQVIKILARGGYTPERTVAKAGIPTRVEFDTNNTFDCSAAVVIPSQKFSQVLPNSGTTSIDLGIPEVGTLRGSCGMGMYGFDVVFE